MLLGKDSLNSDLNFAPEKLLRQSNTRWRPWPTNHFQVSGRMRKKLHPYGFRPWCITRWNMTNKDLPLARNEAMQKQCPVCSDACINSHCTMQSNQSISQQNICVSHLEAFYEAVWYVCDPPGGVRPARVLPRIVRSLEAQTLRYWILKAQR